MKKIDLSKQTLRLLTDAESAAVAGAGVTLNGCQGLSRAVICATQNDVIGCVVPTHNTPCATGNPALCTAPP